MEHQELTVHNPNPQTLLAIAIEKGVAMEQLEKLMDLQDRWERKEAKKAYNAAMSQFQSMVPVMAKNKTAAFPTKNGGKMSYNYSDLGEIDTTIKAALKECGLLKKWEISDTEGEIEVTCIISHVDGHSESTSMKASKDDSGQKNNIQMKASTVTYLQRYTLIGALGITTANTDVDGHAPDQEEEVFDVETAVVGFGKHKGTIYKDLPIDYVQYLLGTAKEAADKAKWQAVLDYKAKAQPQAQQQPAQQATQQAHPKDIPAEDYLPTAALKYNLSQEDMDIWIGLVNDCQTLEELKSLHNRERATFEKYPPIHGLLTTRKLTLQNQPIAA